MSHDISPLGERLTRELNMQNNPNQNELILHISDVEIQLNLIGASLMANFSPTLINSPEIIESCVRCIAKYPDTEHSKCKSCHNLCLKVLVSATSNETEKRKER